MTKQSKHPPVQVTQNLRFVPSEDRDMSVYSANPTKTDHSLAAESVFFSANRFHRSLGEARREMETKVQEKVSSYKGQSTRNTHAHAHTLAKSEGTKYS